jgi:fatty-acyl-CoA synthase
VLYTHRGTILNVLTISGRNGWDLGRGDCVLCAAPFFHCNGWGMPYMAPMLGAKMVLPGRVVSANAMLKLIRTEGVTHSGGVPTVLMDLLSAAGADGAGFAALRHLWTGATAPPEALLRGLEALGPKVTHAFGMTETTQALTVSVPDPNASASEQQREQLMQGQPIFLADVRAVDETGQPLPADGKSVGHLQVRGPAVATAYFRRPDLSPTSSDGWLHTGDIGSVGPTRQLRLSDRAKDAIKSGGEWISSVAIENIAAGCPGVTEAACIGVEHPRWQERPVLLIVREPGTDPQAESIRSFLREKIVSWWMPDEILFVDELPKSGVGKVLKHELRERYRTILNE